MKRIKSFYIYVFSILLIFSCTDADDTIGLEQSTAGAYVKVLAVNSSSFDLNNLTDSYFELQVREWDEEKGGLLSSFDFTVLFIDNTPDNGTVAVSVKAVKSIPASAFSADATGLPAATIRITAEETLAALGLTAADIDGTDVFQFNEELVLTDGRKFSDPNSAVEVGSSTFYKSPFYHNVSVVCNFDDSFADLYVGNYQYESLVDGPNGPVFGDPAVVTLENVYDDNGKLVVGSRKFNVSYVGYPGAEKDYFFDFICTKVVFTDQQSTGLACAAGPSISLGAAEASGTYDISDDGVLELHLTDSQTDGGCGTDPTHVVVRFTKL